MRPRPVAPGGYTLLEVMFVMALVTIVGGIAVPQVLSGLDRSRGLIAARYLAGRFALARMQAISQSRVVAIRFQPGDDGFAFQTFQDGNRNGVLTRDIERGIDASIEPPTTLRDRFDGADIALGPGTPATSPVQLSGGSRLLSFTPVGTATAGTVYVLGKDGTQWAVRVLGPTARTRLLKFDRRTRRWVDQF